jgi:type IV pilus assembly protein PilX
MKPTTQRAGLRPKAKQGPVTKTMQRGAVMIVALMLLLVMTVLAVSGIGNSVLEQKMSGNYNHSATAFQAAEFGMIVAEQWLFDNVSSSDDVTDWFATGGLMNGLYTTQNATVPNGVEICKGDVDCYLDPRDETEWCTGGASCNMPKSFVTLGDTLHGAVLPTLNMSVARQPQFIIEYIGQAEGPGAAPSIEVGGAPVIPPLASFRITVIGWGQETAARHVVQSHVLMKL